MDHHRITATLLLKIPLMHQAAHIVVESHLHADFQHRDATMCSPHRGKSNHSYISSEFGAEAFLTCQVTCD